jgi:hypothetical protein
MSKPELCCSTDLRLTSGAVLLRPEKQVQEVSPLETWQSPLPETLRLVLGQTAERLQGGSAGHSASSTAPT